MPPAPLQPEPGPNGAPPSIEQLALPNTSPCLPEQPRSLVRVFQDRTYQPPDRLAALSALAPSIRDRLEPTLFFLRETKRQVTTISQSVARLQTLEEVCCALQSGDLQRLSSLGVLCSGHEREVLAKAPERDRGQALRMYATGLRGFALNLSKAVGESVNSLRDTLSGIQNQPKALAEKLLGFFKTCIESP